MMNSTRLHRTAWISLAALLSVSGVQAQPFPSRPIEVVVHTNPGGGADLFGRYVVDIINREKLLPQPMAVVNKPGGSHSVAANYVAAKKGDPYTVLTIAHSSFLVVPVVSGLDLGLEKFTPLALYGLDSHTVTVSASSPFNSVKDLVATAKKSPKSVTVGVGTIGGTAHMVGYLLEKPTGVRFNFIGLKGGGDAIVGVMGGHYQVCFENLSEVMEHVTNKKLRVLAVASDKRLPFIPDVPTLKEEGYDVTGAVGRGFLSPAGIPKEAEAALTAAFEKAYKSKAWQQFASQNMFADVFMTDGEFGKWLVSERAKLVPFVQDVGLAKKK